MRSRSATAPLDHLFYALSDPTRRAILTRLTRGEANVTELVRCSRLSFAGVAKHLKVLERGRLVKRRSDRRDRRAFLYALRPEPLQEGAHWLEKYRRYWEDALDEVEGLLGAR